MKSSTIRFIVILGALCIIGITITQIYWVRRAFDLKEAEFERTVNTALYNVAQQIFEISKTPPPAINPVKQVSTNYFIVMVNSEIDRKLAGISYCAVNLRSATFLLTLNMEYTIAQRNGWYTETTFPCKRQKRNV